MGYDSFELKPLSSVSLYIHIPFCSVKCGYCDFYSIPDPGPASMEAVVKGIEAQFLFFFKNLGYPEIRTLYIGGGTPNILPMPLFERLLDFLSPHAGKTCEEWTVELNPEHITPGQIGILNDSPVTRLSIGVQSFDERLLRILKRNASPEETLRGLDIVSALWGGDTSLDLMTSIPGQTALEARGDVRKALGYKPEHISCYALTLEEGVPLFHAFSHEPENIGAWEASVHELLQNGYERYEISNFSLPGHESLHNTAYWRMNPYLGLGPSAVSTLPAEEGIIRMHNTADAAAFGQAVRDSLPPPFERITPGQFLFEYCMMGLRLCRGIDIDGFSAVFGGPPSLYFPETLKKWTAEKYGVYDRRNLRLTPGGQNILNTLLADLLAELDHAPPPLLNWPR